MYSSKQPMIFPLIDQYLLYIDNLLLIWTQVSHLCINEAKFRKYKT